MRLFIDQWNQQFSVNFVKELKTKHCLRGKISKMYVDKQDGTTAHIGYVVGQHWLREFKQVERVR